MREIKFRGYDIDNKCWRYSNGVSFFKIDGIGADIYYYNIDEDSIGQYTGFKDKNGKEIYEGDIIKTEKDKELCQVIFDEYSGMWKLRDLNTYMGVKFSWYKCEVIGNIYEEKLKDGK